MILVLLGTQQNNFNRLLEEIESCIEKKEITEEVIVQAGYTKFSSEKMKILDKIPREELEELISKASLIITHGGVVSIVMALKKQKKVIAVPRLSKYEEQVNDHQIQIVYVFNEKGYIIGIDEVQKLEQALKKVKEFKPKKYESNTGKIINIIENFIDNKC